MSDPITDLINDIAVGAGIGDSVYAPDAELDATVPGWRFHAHGSDAIRHQLHGWFADPGTFEDLQRTPLPTGELVTFTLAWTEDGVPHAAHQAHILSVENERVVRHEVWCGGRWPAQRLAAMADA